MVSYNFAAAQPIHHNHMQSMFERLGWQQIGGSCYRYPRLAQNPPVEDWLNHVVPALMLFRSYVAGHDLQLTKFTLDAHSSTGIDAVQGIGEQPHTGPNIPLCPPANAQFGEANLRNWIDTIPVPYPGAGM
jgi:hypothetical protein